MRRSAGAGPEVLCVEVEIEMVALHEPHQVHGIDGCGEPSVSGVDGVADRLGAGDALIGHFDDRVSIRRIRHRIWRWTRLTRRGSSALTRYPCHDRVDRGVHAPEEWWAIRLEAASDTNGIGQRARDGRTHDLKPQGVEHSLGEEAAVHPPAEGDRLGCQEDIVADDGGLTPHEIARLALENRERQSLVAIDETASDPALVRCRPEAVAVVHHVHASPVPGYESADLILDPASAQRLPPLTIERDD